MGPGGAGNLLTRIELNLNLALLQKRLIAELQSKRVGRTLFGKGGGGVKLELEPSGEAEVAKIFVC